MVTKQQLLDDGSVWATDNKWFRKCPSCGNVVEHTNYFNVRRLHLEKCICSKCAGKLTAIRMKGIRPKMSRLGYSNTEESKRKVSLALKGIKRGPLSDEHKKKLSLVHIGVSRPSHTEETKRKMRIKTLDRKDRLGIPMTIDQGANEWFKNYNKITQSHFKPTRFNDLGYEADGYDDRLHAWIEYDTAYHKQPCIQRKDSTRQNNIIKYFEDNGEPLVEFKRVLAYNNEEIKTVYRGYEYA